jgi:hypothetical protein
MPLSSRLELPYLEPAQAQKHVTHNEALRNLDMLVQMTVEGFDENTPPALPITGQIFALGAAPTGDWAGQADMLALREEGGWHFVAPRVGWTASLAGSTDLRIWSGTAWNIATGQTQNLTGLGVNTSSDPTNRLAVAAPASLLTHEGADHRLTINKASDTDTASLLFQSGWTGHAEMGLAGETGFSIKVSPDGATWTKALSLSADGQTISGSVVQENPEDAVFGQLLKTGSFGLGGPGLSGHLSDYDLLSSVTHFLADPATGTPSNKPVNGRAHAGVHIAANDTRWLQILGEVAGGSDAARLYWRRNYNGTISDWQQIFSQGNILGTASHLNGVPTGALIERGINANGEYVRFADGTQICVRTVNLGTHSSTSESGGLNRSDTLNFGMSATFVGTPAASISSNLFANGIFFAVSGAATQWGVRAATPQSFTSVALGEVTLTAVGRWF